MNLAINAILSILFLNMPTGKIKGINESNRNIDRAIASIELSEKSIIEGIANKIEQGILECNSDLITHYCDKDIYIDGNFISKKEFRNNLIGIFRKYRLNSFKSKQNQHTLFIPFKKIKSITSVDNENTYIIKSYINGKIIEIYITIKRKGKRYVVKKMKGIYSLYNSLAKITNRPYSKF